MNQPSHRRSRLCLAFCALGCTLFSFPAWAQSHNSADCLAPFIEGQTVAGAVTLVASKDEVLDIDTIGWMDIARQTPMREDALFWIASMSKPITATALMMLVDEGRVALEDPVEKYLPEFKGRWLIVERDENHVLLKRPPRIVTIRDILSHVSGLPFKTDVEAPTLDGLPLQSAVLSYTMVPLDFAPGTDYRYSNAGINTAGRIIEVVSGVAYETFLDEKLFQPLRMKDTTFWPSAEQLQRLAKSYKPAADKNSLEETKVTQLRYPLSDRQHRFPMPAGGLFSTAADIAVFCRMILNDGEFNGKRYLTASAVQEMTTRQTPPDLKQSYGLGWATAGTSFGHGGAYATNMNIDRQRGLITVYMVQHAGFPGNGKDAQGVFRKNAEDFFGR